MVALLGAIAVWTFFLALQGDTTLLGDPYYEDTILAPDRAFGPWALCLLVILNAVVTKLVIWYQHHGKANLL